MSPPWFPDPRGPVRGLAGVGLPDHCATCGTRAAPTLTVRTPSPISSGSTAGSAAASPHTDTFIPAWPAACDDRLDQA